MIQEFNLFFCRDDESGNPYLAIADENGNLAQTEVEQLILEKMRGNGPYPVLVRIDDLRKQMDLKKLYGQHLISRTKKKMLSFTDGAGNTLRFGKPIANSSHPYMMISTNPDGEANIRLYDANGQCASGRQEDDLRDYSCTKTENI